MNSLNFQKTMKRYLGVSKLQTKLNIKCADTCFNLESISILVSVFLKLVFPVKIRQ